MSESTSGLLILAGNSLGCVDDIPSRSLAAARSADLVVFEEDRPARQILKAAGIHRSYLRFSEHQQQQTLEEIENCLRKGQTVLYMSDQGMPGLADPGAELVKVAQRSGAKIKIIPGPSSITAALAACPFDTRQFTFLGFLPRESAQRRKIMASVQKNPQPLILLDTPYRLEPLLLDCVREFGPNRHAVLAFDISGPHEDYWYSGLQDLHTKAQTLAEKLNFVLVIQN